MVGVANHLEVVFGVNFVLGKHVKTGHHKAGRGIWVAIAKAVALAVFQHLVQRLDGAVFVNDEVRVVALCAVGVDHLGKHLAIGAVHRFNG